jgi:purine-nucleoside phosphorylase
MDRWNTGEADTLGRHRPDEAAESARYLRGETSISPRTAVILGSGLGDFADTLPDAFPVSTATIPHYPTPTVPGHRGRLVFARIAGHPIVALQGRTHFYESRNLDTVLYPIRVLHELGVRNLVITNAAGGINRSFSAGDIMVITDQLNLTMERSSILNSGKTTPCYDAGLTETAIRQGTLLGIELRSGVYAGVKGPSYETAAEVEMIHRAGGDAVGMSTVFEVMLANALGLRVLGFSCITNLATGIGTGRLSHAEVTEVGNRVKTTFSRLLTATIPQL